MATFALQDRKANEAKNWTAPLREKPGINVPAAGSGRSALRAMQADATANGTAGMSEREIEDEIAASRAGK